MSIFRHHPYRRRGAVGVAVVLALVAGQQAPAGAVPNDEHYAKQLVKKVDGKNVNKHLVALQAIANASNGTRAAGTTGYDRSVAYVALRLGDAGYKVKLDPANFVESWTENSPPTLAVTGGTTYVPNDQFFTFQPSPSGDVTAQIQAVDLVLPPTPTPTSTSGCETSDFAGFVAGRIALVQRGTCPFITKVQNARDAGAAAIIVFNEGQPGRTDAEHLDLGEWRLGIPMVYADFSIGNDLAANPSAVVHLKVDANLQLGTDYNVIAETKKGDPNNVVMVGAHLDSVPEGPGINDNGSGAAAILETALQLANVPVKNKVRFAFWAAEELGLLGSDQYVAKLSAADRDRIRLYLNFDMIASPNFAYKLYDGDDSDAVGAPAGPPGSAQIEDRLETFFDSRGLGHVGTDFDGRSDYGPFIAAGIPAGGIFTGAEGEKTPEEAALFGGTPGVAYDVCYHQACDTLANPNATALDVNSDAIADSTARYAFNLSTIPD